MIPNVTGRIRALLPRLELPVRWRLSRCESQRRVQRRNEPVAMRVFTCLFRPLLRGPSFRSAKTSTLPLGRLFHALDSEDSRPGRRGFEVRVRFAGGGTRKHRRVDGPEHEAAIRGCLDVITQTSHRAPMDLQL